jgi:hypothetical protein
MVTLRDKHYGVYNPVIAVKVRQSANPSGHEYALIDRFRILKKRKPFLFYHNKRHFFLSGLAFSHLGRLNAECLCR